MEDEVGSAAGGRHESGPPPAGGLPTSFRVFSERSASDLEALEWNSCMDLLACLTAPPDSTMSIYRLLAEDQSPKLLSEKITGIGTALAWSPCGRRIAVGDRLGGVAIYDGESGAVLHVRRPHSHPVAALSWADATPAGCPSGASEDPPWSRMLPPLLAVPSSASNMYAEAHDAEAAEPDAGGAFSLLVSADESGLVVVSSGGTFALQASYLAGAPAPLPPSPAQEPQQHQQQQQLQQQHQQLPPPPPPPPPPPLPPPPCPGACTVAWPDLALRGSLEALASRRPRAVRLSPDLRCLAVLLGPVGSASSSLSTASVGISPRTPPRPSGNRGESGSPAVGGGRDASSGHGSDNELVLVLDTRRLAVRRRELALVSVMSERLTAVAGYARRAAETLAQVWRGAVDGFANKMRALTETIEAYKFVEDRSIHRELLLTCCTGNPSDALHTFLLKQTSVQQLLRLERGLMQALEYANLVVSTRLQVAAQHLITILHEMHACAGWAQKFKSIGLEPAPLKALMVKAQDLNRLGEHLLIECSQARGFVRTLFQVLLRLAHKLSESAPSPSEASHVASMGSPTREDMDKFIACMQEQRSLELVEVTARIGAGRGPGTAPRGGSGPPAPLHTRDQHPWDRGQAGEEPQEPEPRSLVDAAHSLGAEVERVGDRIRSAVSSHVGVLACVPLHAPSPWASLPLPELRAVAGSDAASNVPSPRGLGHSTVCLSWEQAQAAPHAGDGDPSEGSPVGPRLLVLWSGSAGGREAELHLLRLRVPPALPGSPAPPRADRVRLSAGRLLAGPGAEGREAGHFLLCQMYDASHVAAVVLQEPSAGSASATVTVCLADIGECEFHAAGHTAAGLPPALPPAVRLDELPQGSVRRSAPLPESYIWASALRAMATRGVCSVYACRARRLLTLDMEVGEEDEEEDEEDEDNDGG